MNAMIDLVGPHGYVHGWIKVGSDGAAASHGKEVAGNLGGGKGVVVGTYNHNRGTVTDYGGREHPVTHIDPSRSEAGFKGDVSTSHLPADMRRAMEAYDRAVSRGVKTEAPGLKTFRQPSGALSNGYGRSLDFAQPKLGSGARFKKLSATLAARGAHNPDALAAYIGRKKYGAKKFGGLSHRNMANSDLAGVLLAGSQEQAGPPASPLHPGLRIQGPYDFMINRSSEDPSVAVVRHRRGGSIIGEIEHLEDGTWAGKLGGTRLEPRTQQRAALLELLGAHNRQVVRADAPGWQQPRIQTPLMRQLGIPAVAGFATPATGSGDGPRMTKASGGKYDPDNDNDNDGSTSAKADPDKDGAAGLTPKGKAIYKKLCAKGFPAARALMFAKRAQSFGGSKAA